MISEDISSLKINSDINIISNLPDYNVIKHFIDKNYPKSVNDKKHHGFTDIKTIKSLKRFESAINKSLINFKNTEVGDLVNSIYLNESISEDYLIALFWNLSI